MRVARAQGGHEVDVGRPLLPSQVPDEVAVLHPKDSFTAAVRHELTTQMPRPVWPLVRPAAIPGEAAPRVPEAQEPADHGAEGHGFHHTSTCPGYPWPAQPLPGALDITDIQDGVGVAGAQAQALVRSIVHLHVASPTRGAHEEPV